MKSGIEFFEKIFPDSYLFNVTKYKALIMRIKSWIRFHEFSPCGRNDGAVVSICLQKLMMIDKTENLSIVIARSGYREYPLHFFEAATWQSQFIYKRINLTTIQLSICIEYFVAYIYIFYFANKLFWYT